MSGGEVVVNHASKKIELRLNVQLWIDDLERISTVILLEEVMLDCEWISCCEEEDEVAVSATVNEACRGISGETGIETRGNEILYDASDLFVFSYSGLLIVAKQSLFFFSGQLTCFCCMFSGKLCICVQT